MAVYFIADTHFGSEDILRYENRPFQNTSAMDETMINNWNNKISSSDIVYFLGDIGDEKNIGKLNGIKYLIKGNHDTEDNAHYRALGFAEVYDLPVIYDNFWILSHEPLYVNRNMPYANIFGHVHSNPAYNTVSSRSYCVCVERIDYTPISLSTVKSALQDAVTVQ